MMDVGKTLFLLFILIEKHRFRNLDGCCYNPRNDSINYMMTAFKVNNQGTNVKELSSAFNQTLTDIRGLIEQKAPQQIQSKL